MNKNFREELPEMKARARVSLLGHFGVVIGAILCFYAVNFAVNELTLNLFGGSSVLSLLGEEAVAFVVSLFRGVLLYGLYFMFMKLQYAQDVSFRDLFSGFRDGADRIIKVQALIVLLTTVCSLPATIYVFMLPGRELLNHLPMVGLLLAVGQAGEYVIRLYLLMTYFLMMDFPDMTAREVILTSVRMMKGHKKELFIMDLGFAPLDLVSIFSLGIAALWVCAYHNAAVTSFYRYLTASGKQN